MRRVVVTGLGAVTPLGVAMHCALGNANARHSPRCSTDSIPGLGRLTVELVHPGSPMRPKNRWAGSGSPLRPHRKGKVLTANDGICDATSSAVDHRWGFVDAMFPARPGQRSRDADAQYGNCLRRTWKRLLDGQCGIVNVNQRDKRFAEIPCQIAAVVPSGTKEDGGWTASEWLSRGEERKMAQFAQYAMAATEEALQDAGWKPELFEQREATGVCLGSGIGNFDEIYNTVVAYEKGGYKKVNPLFVPKLLINLGAGHISMKYGFMGPNHAATTACTTGAHSIGDAARFIACGDADVMVAGGAESCIHPLAIGGFARARSLATDFNDTPEKASRPFDADRAGFVVGEGAAVLILEELEHACARDAHIYAELKGYACSSDAHHMTAPKENGEGAYMAMKKALKQAQLSPAEVDYVNAHATSTVVGDAAENAAIKALLLGPEGKLKAADVNVSSTKGAVGHLLGGAGAIEAAFSVMAIRDNVMPPTINLNRLADGFDCNYAPNEPQARQIDVALTNSFGPRDPPPMRSPSPTFDFRRVIGTRSHRISSGATQIQLKVPESTPLIQGPEIPTLIMATNGDSGRGKPPPESVGARPGNVALRRTKRQRVSGSLVDASGYKFTEKDTKPGKMKVKKTSKASTKKKADDAKDGPVDTSPTSSPLPKLDNKIAASFPTGKPREHDLLETVICKHCKRPVLKSTAAEHIRGCLKAKQEKARKKKEARDAANRAKVVDDKDEDGRDKLDGDDAMKGQKSAKKSAVKGTEDGTKKGKKRKADEDDNKEPKKKKKKDEPKAKTAKPKGPVDVEKQCGVTLPNGAQCARSLTCKSHSMGAKRAVPGRSLPYDMLLQQYQKKNQAKQQRAAIDANAPLPDEIDTNGPVDSDEERDTVMAAIARSAPRPLVEHTLISSKSKYRFVRIKEQMLHAIGGRGGGSLFATDDSQSLFGGSIFQPFDTNLVPSSSPIVPTGENADATGDAARKTPVQTTRKTPVAAAS
ncbi:Thiolase-like subgroup [Penicillium macrosclerotiorum]|uniref:Thiolase-like subgroup n=1 Tax=Penicillium macrosclerotiorum TaxID=303699 RepID=UPI002546BD07|nr:Thiolase-like subgroup [Penicillium macrosclerotiorum]KAJ5662655.1 Thiolase-like subgroup [Penicillium macrosclerotiorum]